MKEAPDKLLQIFIELNEQEQYIKIQLKGFGDFFEGMSPNPYL